MAITPASPSSILKSELYEEQNFMLACYSCYKLLQVATCSIMFPHVNMGLFRHRSPRSPHGLKLYPRAAEVSPWTSGAIRTRHCGEGLFAAGDVDQSGAGEPQDPAATYTDSMAASAWFGMHLQTLYIFLSFWQVRDWDCVLSWILVCFRQKSSCPSRC